MSMPKHIQTQPAAKNSSSRLTNGSGNELSFIQQGDNLLIDARLLHRHLKSGYQFSNWIQSRISDFEFEADKDFFAKKNSLAKKGGHNRIDYLLTIDMAKELAMLERNETGRQIRRYFIQKEKEARGVSQLPPNPFQGIPRQVVNGRDMLPYRQVLDACRMRGDGGRHYRYWMHYVKLDGTVWVTVEMATHIYHSRMVYNDRAVMKASKPVLPLGWDERKGGAL